MIVCVIFIIICFAETCGSPTNGRYYRTQKQAYAVGENMTQPKLEPLGRTDSLRCIGKCNEEAACRVANVFTNGICQVVLSPTYMVLHDEAAELYIGNYGCPAGFGDLLQPGWVIRSGSVLPSCYKFLVEMVTWEQARDLCISLGAGLISLERHEEHIHIENILRSNNTLKGPNAYWTSGNDRDQEGLFRWETTDMPLTYTHWGPKDPTNQHGENCIGIRTFNLYWLDFNCFSTLGVLCEKNAVF